MLDIYKINNTNFLNPPDEYKNKDLLPNFQKLLEEFKSLIKEQVRNQSGISYYKFGDGDYYFLKKQSVGSAKPGKRALSKSYWRLYHREFVRGSKQNDFYLCELLKINRNYFSEIFKKESDYPAEFVYGLLSNKWLTENFSGEIGIIGGKEKLQLIKELLKHERYKEYLNLDEFSDYIEVPQKFAADNIKKLRLDIEKQLNNSNSKIFLYGIGHAKSGISHLFPKYKKAVYLDVGSGIDALAGIIDKNRPYFASWNNFKISNKEIYKNIDYLNFNFDGTEILLDQ